MPSSTPWRAEPTTFSGSSTRWAIRLDRARASRRAAREAATKAAAPFHTRLSMEDRGMAARPTMPSVKRRAT